MGERTDTVTSPMTESMIADENKNREHDRKKKTENKHQKVLSRSRKKSYNYTTITNSQHQKPPHTFQRTGIGFRLNPLELFPDSQLSHSDKAREDVNEREGFLRTRREGVLGGEGVA